MWAPKMSLLFYLSLILIIFQVSNLFALNKFHPGVLLKNVERTIDLQSQLVKTTSKLVIENGEKIAIKHFYFSIEPSKVGNLSSIIARKKKDVGAKNDYKISQVKLEDNIDKVTYRIELKDPIQPGRSSTIEVETVSTHELEPNPKKITQKERQLVKYYGNVFLYTPYTVLKQTTNVILPSRNIENFTKIKPFSNTDSIITYGPFDKQPGFSYEEFEVHFENNNKFLTVSKMERIIEVSHWGNIAVEETIDLIHTGALLKGSFSRYEYTRESKSGLSSIQSFDTVLPAAASDIYYRDDIGNISTSHTRIKKDSVEVNLRPRFPLFGGWKTHYILGYNVPSYEYLFHSGNEYILKMRLLDHIYDDMVIDELVVKIILPEGSKDFQLELPYPVTRLPDTVHYSYLDTTGRPVITLMKKNLVENHIQDFQLKYSFPRYLMLQEPILVVFALYLLFLLVIIYVRLDFSIDKDEYSENKLRIAGQCEKILSAQDKRVTTYNNIDELLVSLKTNKDTNSFLTTMKGINQEYKNTTNLINELAVKLKSDSFEVYDKIQELQKHDKTLKELYNQQQSLYVDKLVPGKISRQQFLEAESLIAKKKEDCVEKINVIIKSLH